MSHRNKLAVSLLGSDMFSFQKSEQINLIYSSLGDYLPEKVLGNQLGVSVFRSGSRADLIDDFKPVLNLTSSYLDDLEVVSLIKKELNHYQNIFGLINSWNLNGHTYFQYPGEATATRPNFPGYGFFLTTVVEIDLNYFKDLAASSLPRSQVTASDSLKKSLEGLQRFYSKKEIIYYTLFESVTNISPMPIEISLKNIPAKS